MTGKAKTLREGADAEKKQIIAQRAARQKAAAIFAGAERKENSMYQEIALTSSTEEPDFTVRKPTLLIRFHSDIDHHNAVQIRTKADRLIERGNLRNVVFDFGEVHFMDSSGIGMIMGRYKQVIFHGGKIAACGVSSEVDRILKISGLYRVMDKFDSAEEAIEAVSRRTGGR